MRGRQDAASNGLVRLSGNPTNDIAASHKKNRDELFLIYFDLFQKILK